MRESLAGGDVYFNADFPLVAACNFASDVSLDAAELESREP